MKAFLSQKAPGFYWSVAALALGVISMICFAVLTVTAFESSEQPLLVFAASGAGVLLSAIAAIKDFGKVPSWAAFIAAAIALFAFIAGRVSYVAFFLSGDVLGTGLSPFFVLTGISLLLTLLCTILSMSLRHEKA